MSIEDFNSKIIQKLPIKTEQNDTIKTNVNWSLIERLRDYFIINGIHTNEQCQDHLKRIRIQSSVWPQTDI